MASDKPELDLSSLRSFTIAEGILLLVLGLLALLFPVIASAWVTVIVALAFLVGGDHRLGEQPQSLPPAERLAQLLAAGGVHVVRGHRCLDHSAVQCRHGAGGRSGGGAGVCHRHRVPG
jgi:hypothetical protein